MLASRGYRVAIFCVVLGTCLGCNGGRASLAVVTGAVEYNGKPLEHGTIVFYPDEGRSATGIIEDGEITEVTTYEPGDGVPLGHVKVVVTSVDRPDADMYTPTKSLIPTKYTQLQTTPLEAEIERGANTVEFKLTD
jgi:hypothetical protein